MRRIIVLTILLVFVFSIHAQVAINSDNSLADSSAILDVKSTTKGFLPPRLSSAERDAISNPAEGLMIYNTDDKEMQVYDSGNWRNHWQMPSTSVACGMDFVDSRDGKVYQTVKIGSQCWMKQNLNYGVRVDEGTNMSQNGINEKYCYDDLESNCDTYGAFYQWNELMSYSYTIPAQGICPGGWHIPTDAEWVTLEAYADSQWDASNPGWYTIGYRGVDAGYHLKSDYDWYASGNGDDSVGFRALPTGKTWDGSSLNLHYATYLWTSTEVSGGVSAYNRAFYSGGVQSYRDASSVLNGMGVRCVRD